MSAHKPTPSLSGSVDCDRLVSYLHGHRQLFASRRFFLIPISLKSTATYISASTSLWLHPSLSFGPSFLSEPHSFILLSIVRPGTRQQIAVARFVTQQAVDSPSLLLLFLAPFIFFSASTLHSSHLPFPHITYPPRWVGERLKSRPSKMTGIAQCK